MLRKTAVMLGLFVILLAPIVGCGGAPGEGATPTTEEALKITGSVDKEIAWTEDEVRSMDAVEAERENNKGEMSTYTGVPIRVLLEAAGVSDNATTVTFIAGGESTARVELAEVLTCGQCIVSFRNQGGFSIVMPGYSGKLQVKGVVEIQVE